VRVGVRVRTWVAVAFGFGVSVDVFVGTGVAERVSVGVALGNTVAVNVAVGCAVSVGTGVGIALAHALSVSATKTNIGTRTNADERGFFFSAFVRVCPRPIIFARFITPRCKWNFFVLVISKFPTPRAIHC
jgi:hypothetical protein